MKINKLILILIFISTSLSLISKQSSQDSIDLNSFAQAWIVKHNFDKESRNKRDRLIQLLDVQYAKANELDLPSIKIEADDNQRKALEELDFKNFHLINTIVNKLNSVSSN